MNLENRKNPPKNRPKVTIVIPCYNARETISQTLQAIQNQTTDFAYETIVIDSSSDGTEQIIQTQFPEVKLIHLDRQTLPGSGRNLGIQHARGEIVAFTDSDCVPDPGWLSQIVACYRQNHTDGVGGCVINGYPRSMTAWVSHFIEFNEWTDTTPEGYVVNIPSCNLSYKRDTFDKYAVSFTDIFPSEDTLLNWMIQQQGGRLYFHPKVKVVHLSRVGFRTLLKHQKRLGLASAQARRVSTLPGQIFVRIPILCIALPCIRWIRASLRFLKKDRKSLLLFWLLTPVYFIATVAWTMGFMSKVNFPESRFKLNKTQSQGSKRGIR